MGKRGRNQKNGPQHSKKLKLRNNDEDVDFNKFDDEIDAFHKKRDMVPLDINDDDIDSDEDGEQPIFDYEGIDGDDDDEDDDDDDEDDDSNLRGLEAKIVRQQKYLKEKLGDVDDEMDDEEEQDEKTRKVWSGRKGVYYGAENKDFEIQSSDEETANEEEEEVMKLQKERAESLRAEDYGLEGDEPDDSDEEPTLGDIMVKGKPKSKASSEKEAEVDGVPMYEEVKKDLNALSKEEQMDVVYSSAPELIGLLAELNDATKQLETHINPLLSKVRKGERSKKVVLNYLEVKHVLLLAYCQAISFYLLLKSEGQPVRDHPVIARLVEIKSLLEKTKELDGHIPDGFENELIENDDVATAMKPASNDNELSSDLFATLNDLTGSLAEKRQPSKSKEAVEPVEMQSVKVNGKKRKTDKNKQDKPVSLESEKMLQFRAALEEKLKLKASVVAPKSDDNKKQKLKKLDGKLETTGDFDDEVMDLDGTRNKGRIPTLSSKLSQIVPAKRNTKKGVSGDDDLPERDDLGERRWKHELRVLARAGVKSKDDDDHHHDQLENDREDLERGGDDDDGDELGNELESGEEDDSNDFYNQIKRQRDAKLKFKAEMYSRNPQVQFEDDTTVDGKRHITTQMEKNRGLTRTRKKQAKNPRKKYRHLHEKAAKRRKGQVREIRQPKFSYDGEATGINPRISRSTRF